MLVHCRVHAFYRSVLYATPIAIAATAVNSHALITSLEAERTEKRCSIQHHVLISTSGGEMGVNLSQMTAGLRNTMRGVTWRFKNHGHWQRADYQSWPHGDSINVGKVSYSG